MRLGERRRVPLLAKSFSGIANSHGCRLINADRCGIAAWQRFMWREFDMGIRKISLGLAAAAVLGVTPVMAAAPVTPSVAKLSLAPAAGANLAVGTRLGATRSTQSSNITSGGAVIAALAAAAVVGGVVAATSNGHSDDHSVSP
jgi:hypothetical protein